eukprot:gene9207-10181_t
MDNIFRELTGKKELTESQILRKVIWIKSLEECDDLHSKLYKCRKQSWYAQCTEENMKFWDCVQRTKEELEKTHGVGKRS